MSPREQLSPREVQVAQLVWQGKTNPEIATVLGCSEQVVKNQLRGVFDKLGVWSRLELALYIASHGGAGWAEELRAQQVHVSAGEVSSSGLSRWKDLDAAVG
jgi:DNA-binding CsgD family transcriptional regulator